MSANDQKKPQINQTKTTQIIIQNLKQKTQNLTQLLEKTPNTEIKNPTDQTEKENLKKKINELQKEIIDLTKHLNLSSTNQAPQTQPNNKPQTNQTKTPQTQPNNKPQTNQTKTPQTQQNQTQKNPQPQKQNNINIKNWEDFSTIAANPQLTIFNLKETQNTFETKIQKNNQIYNYTGQTPKTQNLLKNWLSQQLSIPQERIYEGTIKTK